MVGVETVRLGRKGKRNVVNLAKGGAKIQDVSNEIEAHFLSVSDDNVNCKPIAEKFIVCIGANDIRFCKENGVNHLKRPLNHLLKI